VQGTPMHHGTTDSHRHQSLPFYRQYVPMLLLIAKDVPGREIRFAKLGETQADPPSQPLTCPVKNRNYLHMSTSLSSLSPQQLRRAADLKDKIQSLENELGRILGASIKPVAAVALRKNRKMSAAGRAKIAAAARARWAKVKGRKSVAKPVKKARRKMSAAARAKIAAAARARWKKAKAQGKNSL
jgi:hypothetical protein